MKHLWQGTEGRVYCTISFSGYKVLEAEAKEGTLGFLFKEGEYFPVTFRSGQWTPARKSDVVEFYNQQQVEWMNYALRMPLEEHLLFLAMVDEAEE